MSSSKDGVSVLGETYKTWFVIGGVLHLISFILYAFLNNIKKIYPLKIKKTEVVLPKKMPVVWTANNTNPEPNYPVPSQVRGLELHELWDEYRRNNIAVDDDRNNQDGNNQDVVIQMPRVRKRPLRRRTTNQMQF